MRKEDEFFFKGILVIGAACAVGFGAWGLAAGLNAFAERVVIPIVRFSQWYLDVYGRITLEMVSAAFMLGMGFLFYNHSFNILNKTFKDHCTAIEEKNAELYRNLTFEALKVGDLLKMQIRYEQENSRLKESNRDLTAEVDDLWHDLEQLTEPEKIQKRVEEEERKEAKDELLDHLVQKDWRAKA